jgi:hypothetical protein
MSASRYELPVTGIEKRRFCVKEVEHAERGAPQVGVLPIAEE